MFSEYFFVSGFDRYYQTDLLRISMKTKVKIASHSVFNGILAIFERTSKTKTVSLKNFLIG